MKYRILIFFLSALMVSQCGSVDKSEFEKASGIPLPEGARNTESYDDEKFVKTSAFRVDGTQLRQFITEQDFQKFNNTHLPQFWGINYLKEKPDLTNLDGYYFKAGSSGNLSWIYIADLNAERLWTEIKYPGKSAY